MVFGKRGTALPLGIAWFFQDFQEESQWPFTGVVQLLC